MEVSNSHHKAMAAHQLEQVLAGFNCPNKPIDPHHQHQHQGQQEKKARPPNPPERALKCPRCESSNTKFCYYNNYNLSQPRHFCKNCRRYWTKGGALRNIPVGGGTRKNSSSSKRSNSTPTPTGPTTWKRPFTTSDPEPQPSSASSSSSLLLYPNHPPAAPPAPDAVVDHELDFTGTFSSLLHSNGQFENILDVSSSPAAAADLGDLNRSNDDNLLSWANGWTDLAIYTPGSTFQ